MIAPSAAALALLGLASASPLASRQADPHYPATSISKAFNLVVNVTDPSRDLTPSIQNTFVTSIHVGPGLDLVGVSPDVGRIFYVNGTLVELKLGESTIISDSGTPPSPAGLKLVKDEGTVSHASLNFGPGDQGIGFATLPEAYVFLRPETFVACNSELLYYAGQSFVTINQTATTVDDDGTIHYNIPEGCAPVRLVPECTELNTLPPDAYSSHEFVLDTSCYDDVSAIVWSEYGP